MRKKVKKSKKYSNEMIDREKSFMNFESRLKVAKEANKK